MTDIRKADALHQFRISVFLNYFMGLKLTSAQVEILEDRTKGWVTDLKLAALSTRGRLQLKDYVCAFAGSNRHVLDHPLMKPSSNGPQRCRKFLLQTSILEQFNASLCDAVTQKLGSGGTLLFREKSNHFLVPLDDPSNGTAIIIS